MSVRRAVTRVPRTERKHEDSNPDDVLDRVPQPFGMICELIDEIVSSSFERLCTEREAPSVELYLKSIPSINLAASTVAVDTDPVIVSALSSAYCVTLPEDTFTVVADNAGVIHIVGNASRGGTKVSVEGFRTVAAAELAGLAHALADHDVRTVAAQIAPLPPSTTAPSWRDNLWCATTSILLPPHTPPPAPDMVQVAVLDSKSVVAPSLSNAAPGGIKQGAVRGHVAFAGSGDEDSPKKVSASTTTTAARPLIPAMWPATGSARGFLLAVSAHAVAAVLPTDRSPKLASNTVKPAASVPTTAGAGRQQGSAKGGAGHAGGGGGSRASVAGSSQRAPAASAAGSNRTSRSGDSKQLQTDRSAGGGPMSADAGHGLGFQVEESVEDSLQSPSKLPSEGRRVSVASAVLSPPASASVTSFAGGLGASSTLLSEQSATSVPLKAGAGGSYPAAESVNSGAPSSLGPASSMGIVRIFHIPADALEHGASYSCAAPHTAKTGGGSGHKARLGSVSSHSTGSSDSMLDGGESKDSDDEDDDDDADAALAAAAAGISSSAPPPRPLDVIRWLASVTLPPGIGASGLCVSMDGRFLAVTGTDAVVRVYHLHPRIVCPPPLPALSVLTVVPGKEAADSSRHLRCPPPAPPVELEPFLVIQPPASDPLLVPTAAEVALAAAAESADAAAVTAAALAEVGPLPGGKKAAAADTAPVIAVAASSAKVGAASSKTAAAVSAAASVAAAAAAAATAALAVSDASVAAPPVLWTSMPHLLEAHFTFTCVRVAQPPGRGDEDTGGGGVAGGGSESGESSSRFGGSQSVRSGGAGSISRSGVTSSANGRPVASGRGGHGRPVTVAHLRTPPTIMLHPPNTPGSDGVPVAVGCLAWYSVSPRADAAAKRVLLPATCCVMRSSFNTVGAVRSLTNLSTAAKAHTSTAGLLPSSTTSSFTPIAGLQPEPLTASALAFTPITYPIVASAVFPSPETGGFGSALAKDGSPAAMLPQVLRPDTCFLLTGDAAGFVELWAVPTQALPHPALSLPAPGGPGDKGLAMAMAAISQPPPLFAMSGCVGAALLHLCVVTRHPSLPSIDAATRSPNALSFSALSSRAVGAVAFSCTGRWACSASVAGHVALLDLVPLLPSRVAFAGGHSGVPLAGPILTERQQALICAPSQGGAGVLSGRILKPWPASSDITIHSSSGVVRELGLVASRWDGWRAPQWCGFVGGAMRSAPLFAFSGREGGDRRSVFIYDAEAGALVARVTCSGASGHSPVRTHRSAAAMLGVPALQSSSAPESLPPFLQLVSGASELLIVDADSSPSCVRVISIPALILQTCPLIRRALDAEGVPPSDALTAGAATFASLPLHLRHFAIVSDRNEAAASLVAARSSLRQTWVSSDLQVSALIADGGKSAIGESVTPNRRPAPPATRGSVGRSNVITSGGASSLNNGRSVPVPAASASGRAMNEKSPHRGPSRGDEVLGGRGDMMRWAVLGPIQQPTESVEAAPTGAVHLRGLRTAGVVLPPPPLTGAPSELAAYYDSMRSVFAPVVVQRLQHDMQRIATALSSAP